MMRNCTTALLGLLLSAPPAFAQSGIYRCTDADGTIAYQDSPCRDRQSQVTVLEPRKRALDALPADNAPISPGMDAKASAGPALGDNGSLLAGNELVMGMSDTKVLNMRGWGRPQHIARSRGEAGWREEWTYVSRADGTMRTVEFLNGKVAGLTTQGEQQIASLTWQNGQHASARSQDAQSQVAGSSWQNGPHASALSRDAQSQLAGARPRDARQGANAARKAEPQIAWGQPGYVPSAQRPRIEILRSDREQTLDRQTTTETLDRRAPNETLAESRIDHRLHAGASVYR